jgi:hypothetical protein
MNRAGGHAPDACHEQVTEAPLKQLEDPLTVSIMCFRPIATNNRADVARAGTVVKVRVYNRQYALQLHL